MKLIDRFISRAFRVYICAQPCAHCGAEHSTPAHEISRKKAEGSDALCINLCIKCHRILDDWGKSKTEKALQLWGLNIGELHAKLWNGFMATQGFLHSIYLPGDQRGFEIFLEHIGLRDGSDSKRKNRGELSKAVNQF